MPKVEKEKIEEKIGECLGLERAAQQAVEELNAKGLLDKKKGLKTQLEKMKKEAGSHQSKLEQVIDRAGGSMGLNKEKIEESAEEAVQKATEMMKTYLGEEPETVDALEFLCLAEAGEVTHYEVLGTLTRSLKDKKLGTAVKSILREEKRHLQLCMKLAKQSSLE
jgi:ferritin-like metal-binding protein YciE